MNVAAEPTPNPAILVWARQESGLSVERIAKRLAVSVDKILAWEAGKRSPTLRQLEKLAAFLRRPLSLFFQEAPPDLPPLATEYRRLAGVHPGEESPELRLALRQMIARREHALELLAELATDPEPLALRAHTRESAIAVAARLRAASGITPDEQLAWRDGWQAWRHWRAAVEGLGVLVFQFPSVALAEVRGLSLLHQPLPVIGINSKETVPEARVFTLIHELTHLALAGGGEEAPAVKDHHSDTAWQQLERFAEAVASHTILPADLLENLLLDQRPGAFDVPTVRSLARRVGLTPLALATRLRADSRLSAAAYQTWRRDWDDWLAQHPPRGGGFALPDQRALGRNGRPFVRLVIDALAQNRITATDAARYLGLRYQHFQKLTERLIGSIDHGGNDA